MFNKITREFDNTFNFFQIKNHSSTLGWHAYIWLIMALIFILLNPSFMWKRTKDSLVWESNPLKF